MDGAWEATVTSIIASSLRDIASKKELEHVQKLVSGWGTFFANSVSVWLQDVSEKLSRKASIQPPNQQKSLERSANAVTSITTGKRSLGETFANNLEHEHDTHQPNTTTTTTSFTTTTEDSEKDAEKKSPSTVILSCPLSDCNGNVTDTQMLKLALAMSQYYLVRTRDLEERLLWRVLVMSSMWLLRQHLKDYQSGEDRVAMACASIYLAGKVENMFLKYAKIVELLRVTSASITKDIECVIPSEEKVGCSTA
jgi:hypothetical protein